MTTPTGRPRGRPKTKEYVTLMARVPQELADRVQRYAGLHQQPISVVLRDALEVLLEEDRYHPFLSDMNRAPDNVSDTKAESASIMSDMKEEQAYIVSDMNDDTPATSAVTPPHTRSAKVSDTKEGVSACLTRISPRLTPVSTVSASCVRVGMPMAPQANHCCGSATGTASSVTGRSGTRSTAHGARPSARHEPAWPSQA